MEKQPPASKHWGKGKKNDLPTDIVSLYRALYHGAKGFISLCTREPHPQATLKVQGFFSIDELDRLLERAFGFSGRAHVYHGLHPLREKPVSGRGRKRDILGAAFLAADIDAKDFIDDEEERKKAKREKEQYRWKPELLKECKEKAIARIRSIPLTPFAVVDSGHGFYPFYALQAFWIFKDHKERERFENLSQRLHHALGADSTFDVTRILRVAGTMNIKPGYPVRCELVNFNSVRYDPTEIERLLEDTPNNNGEKRPFLIPVNIELPDETRNLIQSDDSGPYPSRSEKDMAIIHRLVKAGLSDEEIKQVFRNNPCGAKYLEKKHHGDEYLSHTINKVRSENKAFYTKEPEEEIHETDLGNAKRMIKLHGRDLRYCHPWKKWLVWNGQRWVKDNTAAVFTKAKDVIMRIYAEATQEQNEKRRKALAKHAIRSEAETRIKAMISLATSEPGIPVLPEELDSDKWALNCKNGTIDLKTGELRPHRRDDMLTQLAPVEYDPKAECPRWLQFLDEIMDGNQNLISFLQRAAGYSLTGETREHVLFILFGSGQNGKSTFLNTLLEMLGDYGSQAAPDMLMSKKNNRHPTELADLFGKRFVVSIETEEGRRLAESLIKQLTGGDRIKARRMREDFWEFWPTHKIWLATNHRPQVRGTDHAIWSRLKLIPFNVQFPDGDPRQDKTLQDKLKKELPGILRWCVEGCLAWQQEGLGIPKEVEKATEEYRKEMDILTDFFTDCCVIDKGVKVKAKELYTAYCKWCKENSEQELSQRAFGMRLSERGFTRGVSNSVRWWYGIRLKE